MNIREVCVPQSKEQWGRSELDDAMIPRKPNPSGVAAQLLLHITRDEGSSKSSSAVQKQQ